MLSRQGEPVLLDFGLAWRSSSGPADGAFFGTPEYLAPEQVEAMDGGADPRTDVYALGLIGYELATLERAFARRDGEELGALFERIRAQRFPPLSESAPDMPLVLRAILTRMLAPGPLARYASMREVEEDLTRLIAGLPPRHARVPLSTSLSLWSLSLARRPLVAAGALCALGSTAYLLQPAGAAQITHAIRLGSASDEIEYLGDADSLEPSGDIGVQVTGERPAVLYSLSIYGGDDAAERLVRPTRSLNLRDGTAERAADGWGLHLPASESFVACAHLTPGEADEYEGFRVYLRAGEDATLGKWMTALEAGMARDHPRGVPLLTAQLWLDDPATRGGDPRLRASAPARPSGRKLPYYERVYRVQEQR
jgi:hypothetical protein